jgi:gamma-glutamylcyclotransferase (GGCT)/AIG2-like uncharacterized protein YtfP
MKTVFVYGTLKLGFGNHRVMERSGGQFIASDTLPAGMFQMLNLGFFPGLVESANGSEISGEVFEVESMAPLDQLEGYPRFYNRMIVETGGGRSVWVYFLENSRTGDVVASGNWDTRCEQQA